MEIKKDEKGGGYYLERQLELFKGETPCGTKVEVKAKSPGLKYDAEKPSLSLIDPIALELMAKVLDHGKAKYSAHNWRGGIQWSRTIDAALRHLNAFNNGEDIDKESGLPHIAHAMVNCMFLLRFMQDRAEFDDRYKEPKANGHCVR